MRKSNPFVSVELVFNRQKRASRTTTGAVEVLVRYKSKRKYMVTGVKLFDGQWDDNKHVVNRYDTFQLNSILDSRVRCVRAACEAVMDETGTFSFDAFDAELSVSKSEELSFVDFILEETEKGNYAPMTKGTYRTLANQIRQYGKMEHFSDLTRQNIINFYQWRRTQLIRKVDENGEVVMQEPRQQVIYSTHKRLKTFILKAMNLGLMKSNPIEGLKIDRGRPKERIGLNDDEYAKVRDCTLTHLGAVHARDMFIIQCATGMAYIDMVEFDWHKGLNTEGGIFTIDKCRHKTGIHFHTVMLPDGYNVLKKYDFNPPRLSLQVYNRFLRIVEISAGISKHITSHVGRHTFATRALNHNIPIEVVQRMLGHNDVTTTQIYAKMIGKTIDEAMAKNMDKF